MADDSRRGRPLGTTAFLAGLAVSGTLVALLAGFQGIWELVIICLVGVAWVAVELLSQLSAAAGDIAARIRRASRGAITVASLVFVAIATTVTVLTGGPYAGLALAVLSIIFLLGWTFFYRMPNRRG
jgi:hypothetical protein